MFKSLGKNGEIYFDSEFNGSFSRNLNTLFSKFMEEFANISMKFRRSDYEDFPFVYREKTLPSVLIPAFIKASDTGIVFSEYPVDRKKLTNRSNQITEERSGRVDYFIFHKGMEIIVESKFSWISYNSLKTGGGIREQHINLLREAVGQLGSIKWEGAEKIALMVTPVYYSIDSEKDVKIFKNIERSLIEEDLLTEIYNRILMSIRKDLAGFQSFLGYWYLPISHEYYLEWENRYESYPYVLFIGGRV